MGLFGHRYWNDDLEVPDHMFHCKKCNTSVHEGDEYCSGCGRKLNWNVKKDEWIIKV